MSMRQQDFAMNFASSLQGKLPPEDVNVVLRELNNYSATFDIQRRNIKIFQPYQPHLPDCYNRYFIAKQINGVQNSSLSAYDECLQDFFKYVNKPLNEIDVEDIRSYLHYLETVRNLSKRTLDGRRLIINGFLEWCKNEQIIESNQCRRIAPIKYNSKPRQPLTDMELEEIRYACKRLRDKAILEFFYSTGCRVSEVVALNKQDINFATGEVMVFGKGGTYRIVYLNARVVVLLRKYLESRTDCNDALFVACREPYQRLKKSAMESILRNLGHDADIGRNVFPHLIRHTTATDALGRGMDVTEVKEMLGHKKLETTMIYAKPSQVNLKHNHRKYIV